MDLQELSLRTGLDKRKLRYCLDHRLIPGLRIEVTQDEAGRPRKFADDVGFAIVCAAKLLETGLPHASIRLFLQGLSEITVDGSAAPASALASILEHGHPAIAQFGDNVNVRLMLEEIPYNSGWRAPGNPARLADDYEPVVVISLDIGSIRQKIFS